MKEEKKKNHDDPRYSLREFRNMHRCDVCLRWFAWSSESHVFGSLAHEDENKRQFKICSRECHRQTPSIRMMEYIVGKVDLRGRLHGAHWEEWDSKTGPFEKRAG